MIRARQTVITATALLFAMACSEDKGPASPNTGGGAGRSDASNTGSQGGATASTGQAGTSGGSSTREGGSKAGSSQRRRNYGQRNT